MLVDASLLLLLTSTPGLLTADPRVDPSAELVSFVDDPSELEALSIGSATSPLGSGGMRSKVAAAEMATAAGIPTVIGSGFEPGLLGRAWAGEKVGTRFAPHPVRQPSFKLWLRYAKPDAGRRTSTPAPPAPCATAAPRCCRSASSASTAPSRPATRSTSASTATTVGKGISNYSAGELRRVMGLKSPKCARCCRARSKKPSTGTTSSWSDRLW